MMMSYLFEREKIKKNRAIRDRIANDMCNGMPSNIDGIVDDHTAIACAVVDGKSWDQIEKMQELNNWPSTYVWLKKEMEEIDENY